MEGSYDGPRLEENITAEFMTDLLAFFKDQKRLHRKYAYKVNLYVLQIVGLMYNNSHTNWENVTKEYRQT